MVWQGFPTWSSKWFDDHRGPVGCHQGLAQGEKRRIDAWRAPMQWVSWCWWHVPMIETITLWWLYSVNSQVSSSCPLERIGDIFVSWVIQVSWLKMIHLAWCLPSTAAQTITNLFPHMMPINTTQSPRSNIVPHSQQDPKSFHIHNPIPQIPIDAKAFHIPK